MYVQIYRTIHICSDVYTQNKKIAQSKNTYIRRKIKNTEKQNYTHGRKKYNTLLQEMLYFIAFAPTLELVCPIKWKIKKMVKKLVRVNGIVANNETIRSSLKANKNQTGTEQSGKMKGRPTQDINASIKRNISCFDITCLYIYKCFFHLQTLYNVSIFINVFFIFKHYTMFLYL